MTQEELLRLIDQAAVGDWHELILVDNQLSSLPPEIGQLTNLQRLVLWSSQLTTLPPDIGQLANLRELDLWGNQLTVLPPEIGQLANLRKLDISQNRFSALPSGFGQLINLQKLDMRGNRFSALPPEFGQLVNLKELILSGNRLKTLPSEIGQLINLRKLDISHNRLSTLPPEISQLENLNELTLGNNPWNETFATLVQRPMSELMAYLCSLLEELPQFEAKVLLIGEGAVGKSSLLRAFNNEPFQVNLPTTHGIEVKQVHADNPQPIETPLTLNFWDFGGQEVYRITHQFFFSRQALYLLVWKPREGREENALEDWLERIHLRVGDEAKVIIVATHGHERYPELDYPSLQARYPHLLAGHFTVDNLDSWGITELKAHIAQVVAAMEHVGVPFNVRWLETRDELQHMDRTHVTRDEFDIICARHGLDKDASAALRSILHTQGRIIAYEVEGLRDFVVLKPEWLTKAISYVLEDRVTREQGGYLDHRRLRAIWQDHGDANKEVYPQRYFPYFLRLMEEFDVSYRISEGDASLIAQLAPYQRPELPWQPDSPLKDEQTQMQLLCEMKQNPPGLIPWLTVRNHRWATGLHWRRGVFLRHRDGHEALIDYVGPPYNRLSFTVRGAYPAHFMHLLQDGLEALIQKRWPYLDYSLSVPCPTITQNGPCPGRFSLETLYRARRAKRRTWPCDKCMKEIDIGRLLEGYALPAGSFSQQLADMEARLLAEHARAAGDRALMLRNLQSLRAEAAAMTRRVLRALTDEAMA